jgi:hypothetical protein
MGSEMSEPNDAAVERLAKELSRQDGNEWEMEWKLPLPSGAKPTLKPILDEAGREKYLVRAREQLMRGSGGG